MVQKWVAIKYAIKIFHCNFLSALGFHHIFVPAYANEKSWYLSLFKQELLRDLKKFRVYIVGRYNNSDRCSNCLWIIIIIALCGSINKQFNHTLIQMIVFIFLYVQLVLFSCFSYFHSQTFCYVMHHIS